MAGRVSDLIYSSNRKNMHETVSNYEAFEAHMRGKKFKEAAAILIEHCVGLNVEAITEMLAVAAVMSGQLKIPKQAGPRRRRVENAYQKLKTPAAVITTKAQRAMYNSSLHRPY
jgi:hypothetical protein